MCHAKEWPDSQQLCATAMGKAIHKGTTNKLSAVHLLNVMTCCLKLCTRALENVSKILPNK